MPENYHGTAFTEPEDTQEQQPIEQQETSKQQEPVPSLPVSDAVPTAKKEEGGLLSSLFSGFGGLRSDDLLLLALIVLLSRSGDKDGHSASEILPLLALLLFIG